MRTFAISSTVALVALSGAIGLAQAPAKIATMADHVALMKSNAQANATLNKSVGSGAFAEARTAAGTLRTNLTTLQTFWTEKKNADATKILADSLVRLDALDKVLAAPMPDQMTAQAAAKEFGGNTCGPCHKMLREGDAQTGFRFREGTNPF